MCAFLVIDSDLTRMSSQSPESKPKTMSNKKPLNPDATPFQIPPPATRNCGPSLPTSISNAQSEPQGRVNQAPSLLAPSEEATLAYGYDYQLVLPYPTQPQALMVFPDHNGTWYAQPFAAYHPAGVPVCTSISQQHPIYQNLDFPMDRSESEGSIDHTHRGFDHEGEDEEIDGSVENEMHEAEIKAEAKRGGEVELEWRAKAGKKGGCGDTPFPTTMEEAESSGTTTLMIRNVPNYYQFKDLLPLLDDHCCEQNRNADRADWSMFDFVYLPMDFRKHSKKGRVSNLGYAFVNFTTASAAFKFYQQYHGNGWDRENKKKCNITAAHIQGKEALVDQFCNKVYRCKSAGFLPVVFSEPRHGFNRETEGTTLGKFVEGQPRKTLASWVSPKTKERRPTSSSSHPSSIHETEDELELSGRTLDIVSRVQSPSPSPNEEK